MPLPVEKGENMFETHSALSDCLSYEFMKYFDGKKDYFRCKLLRNTNYLIYKWQVALRKSEYHIVRKNNFFHFLLWIYYSRKKNKRGSRLGIDIPENVFEKGLRIYHYGMVSVNPNAKVGEDCIIVGNVCIGNKNGQNVGPHIGSNCMFGFGSSAIGGIELKNDVAIAAGAVVTKSFDRDDIILAGIPANIIR